MPPTRQRPNAHKKKKVVVEEESAQGERHRKRDHAQHRQLVHVPVQRQRHWRDATFTEIGTMARWVAMRTWKWLTMKRRRRAVIFSIIGLALLVVLAALGIIMSTTTTNTARLFGGGQQKDTHQPYETDYHETHYHDHNHHQKNRDTPGRQLQDEERLGQLLEADECHVCSVLWPASTHAATGVKQHQCNLFTVLGLDPALDYTYDQLDRAGKRAKDKSLLGRRRRDEGGSADADTDTDADAELAVMAAVKKALYILSHPKLCNIYRRRLKR